MNTSLGSEAVLSVLQGEAAGQNIERWRLFCIQLCDVQGEEAVCSPVDAAESSSRCQSLDGVGGVGQDPEDGLWVCSGCCQCL